MSDLQIEVRQRPDGLIVRLVGEAGVHVGPNLEIELTRICARRAPLVVMDLSDLTFISSLVMGQLVATHHALIRAGGRMRLAAVPPAVMESLKRARLDTMLQFAPTVEMAFAE